MLNLVVVLYSFDEGEIVFDDEDQTFDDLVDEVLVDDDHLDHDKKW